MKTSTEGFGPVQNRRVKLANSAAFLALTMFVTLSALAQTPEAAPPPAAPAKRSAAELEKLVMPIALHPDPLIASILPASVYPLEIVQAARFVKDTNNIPKVDEQDWDDNVKAVAKFPDMIAKMDKDISWTMELGQAFLDQPKELMDTIQALRLKAQKAGTLQNTPQQNIIVTNIVVMQTNATQIVTVTNTVVQVQPSNPSVVYVPSYPTTVYAPPPGYVYSPYAPLISFGVGMAWGAILANNCDWFHGGCYHGDVDIDVDRNVNRNVNRNTDRTRQNTGNRAAGTSQKKWQPDQSRLNKSGASASPGSREARGWGGASTQAGNRAGAGGAGARPSQPTSNFSQRPSAGTQPARTPGAGTSAAQRPATTGNRAGTTSTFQNSGASRGGQSPSAGSRPSSSPSVSRPSTSGGGSAFGGVSSGSFDRGASSRGSASRGGGGGGSRGGGGGGRGGGRR